MQWFAGGVLFGQVARRLAHEKGIYASCESDASDHGWLTPETDAWFERFKRQDVSSDAEQGDEREDDLGEAA